MVNRLVYLIHPPKRGDVILFQYARAGNREFVKRVVAVPGDLMEERDGRLWVNGASVADAEARPAGHGPLPTLAPLRIPEGQLFVLGDNQAASLDSRFWGTADRRRVIGKAFLIYWSQGEHWWSIRWNRIGRRLP